ncbi:MAG TPA: TetR/AcrR family transcriptional regulator [Rhizomicrobium sp.]|jgi:AcrR family transcriptional regulator|nr:TetR/AcrR family transcriptional regulator [Rhizomicrobium sp.]
MSSPVKSLDEARPARRKPESLAKIKKSARKLFVERGYHATRPQDIAREAGLGHGTFYLHYPDKRACFLAFVDDARVELDEYLTARRRPGQSLEQMIETTLDAIFEYSQSNPGVLNAAMTDEAIIDAEGVAAKPLLQRWGEDWAKTLRDTAQAGHAYRGYDADIVGQAILGAIHQTASAGYRAGRNREDVVKNLTRFLVRALAP